MIHLRPPFIAVYVRASGPDDRSIDEQVRLTRACLRDELDSGRLTGAAVCYYLDPAPSDEDQLCWGLERLMDDAHSGNLLAVVCDRFERFHASPARAASAIAFLELEGIHLVLLDEGVDAARLPRDTLAELARSILLAGTGLPAQATPSDGLRVASYVRVATGGAGAQAAIDSQLRRTEAYLADRQRSYRWTIQSHVCYQDVDASGKDRDRLGLRQLEHDVAAGQIDVVICTRLDRLARTVHDVLELLELFQTHGVRFIAIQDDIGPWADPSIPPAVAEAILNARYPKAGRPGE
jgi:DNA invertase Pin-like site-specific DNA recombinase